MQRWMRIVAVVVGVAAVAALALTAFRSMQEPTAMTGVIVAPANVALDVSDQTSPAGQLDVDTVRVPGASWIIVSSLDGGDTPAHVVGMRHVAAGESVDVTVPLDATVGMNQQLRVTLQADRGIIGRYEFDETRYEASPDKPYFVAGKELSRKVVKDTRVLTLAEAGGASAADEVAVTPGGAALEVGDRLTVLDELVVDRVVAPGPSLLVVYLVDGSGRPTSAAGIVPVAAGEHMNVSVPIPSDVALTDKLLVALQADLRTPGVLDFAPSRFSTSSDKPYAVSGGELSRSVLLRGYGMDFDNTAGEGSGM